MAKTVKYLPIKLEKEFISKDKKLKSAKKSLDDTKAEIHRELARGHVPQLIIVSESEEGVSSIKWQEVANELAAKLYPDDKQFKAWQARLKKKYPNKARAAAISSPKQDKAKESNVVSISKGRRHAA